MLITLKNTVQGIITVFNGAEKGDNFLDALGKAIDCPCPFLTLLQSHSSSLDESSLVSSSTILWFVVSLDRDTSSEERFSVASSKS